MVHQNTIQIASLTKEYRGYRIEVIGDRTLISKDGGRLSDVKSEGRKFTALSNAMSIIDAIEDRKDISVVMSEFREKFPVLMDEWDYDENVGSSTSQLSEDCIEDTP